jgi:hypothetical protein
MTSAFLMIFVLCGLGILVYCVYNLKISQDSYSWPTAEGVVTHSAITNDGTVYLAVVNYQFSVNGESHSGSRVTFQDYGEKKDPAHAQGIVNKYSEGTKVRVHYSKKDTDLCVLEPGIQRPLWLVVGIGLAFFLIGTRGIVIVNRQDCALPLA